MLGSGSLGVWGGFRGFRGLGGLGGLGVKNKLYTLNPKP